MRTELTLCVLVLATAASARANPPQSVPPDPEPRAAAPAEGSIRVGRAADWTGAVLLRADVDPAPLPTDFAHRRIGHPTLLVAPRAGEPAAADVEAARGLLPPTFRAHRHQRDGWYFVVAAATPDAPLTSDRGSTIFFRDIDTRYAAPPRPWIALLDRRGIVRVVAPLADRGKALWREEGVGHPLPEDRGLNTLLVGRPMEPVEDLVPRDTPETEAGDPDLDTLRAPPGGLVLYRFWTEGCPHCKASLPALADLAARVDGFRIVPVHHRKSPIERSDAWLAAYLADLDHDGPWARDPDWTVLKRLMERGRLRAATSVSFLVDDLGIIRWVHRGPRVHPDADGEHGPAGTDFATLERIVTDWCKPAEASDRVAPSGDRR